MTTVAAGMIVFLIGQVVVVLVAELSGDQLREWTDRWPLRILGYAVRRLPAGARDEFREEWTAELLEILHGGRSRAVLRLWQAMRYSLGLLRAAPYIDGGDGSRRGSSPALPDEQLLARDNFVTIILLRESPLLVACGVAGRYGPLLAIVRFAFFLRRYWVAARAGPRKSVA